MNWVSSDNFTTCSAANDKSSTEKKFSLWSDFSSSRTKQLDVWWFLCFELQYYLWNLLIKVFKMYAFNQFQIYQKKYLLKNRSHSWMKSTFARIVFRKIRPNWIKLLQFFFRVMCFLAKILQNPNISCKILQKINLMARACSLCFKRKISFVGGWFGLKLESHGRILSLFPTRGCALWCWGPFAPYVNMFAFLKTLENGSLIHQAWLKLHGTLRIKRGNTRTAAFWGTTLADIMQLL